MIKSRQMLKTVRWQKRLQFSKSRNVIFSINLKGKIVLMTKSCKNENESASWIEFHSTTTVTWRERGRERERPGVMHLYWCPNPPEMSIRVQRQQLPEQLQRPLFMNHSNNSGKRMSLCVWEQRANNWLDRCSLCFHLNTLHQPWRQLSDIPATWLVCQGRSLP